ncbi:hypothetical protein L0Y59_00415 [Candidatus Uhrbacteria bacterium]|nr:hypothetical protein [Candidatus Uhrbacteria bacterium]
MFHVVVALLTGAAAGAVILLLSHLAPRVGAGAFVRDIDRPVLLGKSVSRRGSHVIGMAVYLALAAAFGACFAVFVEHGAVSGYDVLPIFVWGTAFACMNGLVVLPLEGHGLFGAKEDVWFPIDVVVTSLLWAVLFWWFVRLWSVYVMPL